jgi:hypothetical protein
MKAYVIRPNMEVFDGTGSLSADALHALRLLAEVVAESLLQGGDTSHQAAIWDGPVNVGTPPTLVTLPDRQSVVDVASRLLDPNGLVGGDIRSVVNCRMATFGQDGQAMLCLRHEDTAPISPDPSLLTVTECSERLVGTDLFDGGWPSA